MSLFIKPLYHDVLTFFQPNATPGINVIPQTRAQHLQQYLLKQSIADEIKNYLTTVLIAENDNIAKCIKRSPA